MSLSLEFEYLHQTVWCKMLIGRDNISNDAITLVTSFSMFVYIRTCFRFMLIGGNLTAKSTRSHRGIGGGIKNSRGIVARSPSFSHPTTRAPRETCSQTMFCKIMQPKFLNFCLIQSTFLWCFPLWVYRYCKSIWDPNLWKLLYGDVCPGI